MPLTLPSFLHRDADTAVGAQPSSFRLQPGQALRFARPRRLCLRVTAGPLWVTVDGEPDDIVLGCGECRVFDGSAAVVATPLIEAVTLTAVSLAPAPTWRQRLAATMAAQRSFTCATSKCGKLFGVVKPACR